MKALQLDKLLKAEATQRDSLSAILPPRPCQIWTGEVRTVDKHGSGLYLPGQLLPLLGVFRPDRGGQPELAVVHVGDGGRVGGDGHDGDNRAEGLVAHNRHFVGDVGEESGFDEVSWLRKVVEGGVCGGFVFGASIDGVRDLGEDCLLCAYGDNGPNLGGLVHRIADFVFGEDGFTGGEKRVIDVGVDVNALDGAAGLTRVEDGAVDDFFGGPLRIDVWSDVCWVFAAEFEANVDDSIGGCFLNGQSASD